MIMHETIKRALGVDSANCLSCFNFDSGKCLRHNRRGISNLLYFPFVGDQKCWFPEIPASYLEAKTGFNSFLLLVKVHDNGKLWWPDGVSPKFPKKKNVSAAPPTPRKGAEAAFTRLPQEGDEPEALICKKCGTVSRFAECPFCHTKKNATVSKNEKF